MQLRSSLSGGRWPFIVMVVHADIGLDVKLVILVIDEWFHTPAIGGVMALW